MMQKYQTLRKNILPRLIITNLRVIYLMQRKKGLLEKSAIAGFTNNADLNKKVATLAAKAELKAEQNSQSSNI